MGTKYPVDDAISAESGKWEFNDEVAASFDCHVRKSVPLYDALQHLAVDLCDGFIRDGSVVYDLGASTGESILLLKQRYADRGAIRYIAVDKSGPMLDKARAKCGGDSVTFLVRDAAEMTAFPDADCVLCIYTLQFVPLDKREALLAGIHESLSPGGALILAEKVLSEDARLNGIWADMLTRFKLRQGLTAEMILQKEKCLEGVLAPVTLAQNVDMLRRAGFESIDVFAKWCGFAGLIALKAPKEH